MSLKYDCMKLIMHGPNFIYQGSLKNNDPSDQLSNNIKGKNVFSCLQTYHCVTIVKPKKANVALLKSCVCKIIYFYSFFNACYSQSLDGSERREGSLCNGLEFVAIKRQDI